jgi:hypothetical protein
MDIARSELSLGVLESQAYAIPGLDLTLSA